MLSYLGWRKYSGSAEEAGSGELIRWATGAATNRKLREGCVAVPSPHCFRPQPACPCPPLAIKTPVSFGMKMLRIPRILPFSPCLSSIENTLISSSSSTSVNPTGFGLLNENSFWRTNNNIGEPFDAAKIFEVMQSQDQENQPNKICDTQMIIDNTKGVHDNMDASFDTTSYDLEFVDSTLLPGSMCRDLSSMDDLAWNF
ncbi:hypothetical protein OIU76_013468 [Salix suchowensis]|nr:hypothetical protein OIU76_013468 [Salix suchowensis]